MAKEICISSTPHETRLAILEDDQLAEIYYERENEYTLAGSVYKGRVTRVLPGMQSAFVDIGLERDAFLYVTDFLEMEDQEDTDEVERAATQGTPVKPQTSQPQVRPERTGERTGERGGDRDQRPRREGRDNRPPAAEVETQGQFPAAGSLQVTPVSAFSSDGSAVPASVADATAQQDETDEQGARRWRGRRRRRGGRGRDDSGPGSTGAGATGSVSPEILDEGEEVGTPALEFEAVASQAAAHSYGAVAAQPEGFAESRKPAAATPFLLPGESLSKYGAPEIQKPGPSRLIVSELPPDTSDPLPDRTVAKPSTLIEDEIVWDGKGLMPGESIARHRKAEAAPVPSATVEGEPSGVLAAHALVESEQGNAHEIAPAAPVPVEFSEEIAESEPDAPVHLSEEDAIEELEEEDYLESGDESDVEFEGEAEVSVPVLPEGEAEWECETASEDQPEVSQRTEEDVEEHPVQHDSETGHDETHEEIHDASASHNVDPLPPSGFRFSDLFGGRKKDEEPAPAAAQAPTKAVTAVSAYAPGEGLVEEEVIEEEEYEFTPLKAHHGDDHDLDELEEETLQQQIRSGALGEMLQEAHLDHRIQLESSDEDESDLDEDEEDAVGAPAGAGRAAPAAPGRERSGDRGGDRGRRGGRGRNGGPGGGDGRRGPGGPSGQSRRSAQTSDLPIISDLLKPGQEILVQIAKEPIAKKGARITSHIALPGRFLVFMPTVSHVGVSRKIASDEERQRLKRILVSEKGDASGGFIVRTAADGATEEELRADLRFLINLWNDIKQRADSSKPPALIYHDLNLIERILRDQVSDNFSHIWVDSEADYERIVRFLNRFSPELVRRVKLYTKEVPLFEHFGIQEEISKALRSKVWLKSGGSIVINQTEALVAIDINTGKFVGKTARLEDTILKTNLDAIPEIVRQIRLRDLGGIIVIDFIDMDERKNRTRVMAALEEALKQDRAPTKVLQFNDFGLVAITRKRVKQSLERTLSVPCPVCQATGMVKSAATVANEIYIEMRKMRKHFDQSEVLLRVNPETAKALKANNAKWLTELEELAGKNVLVKSDATLHPEQFDIQG
jgi:ribonuclease G